MYEYYIVYVQAGSIVVTGHTSDYELVKQRASQILYHLRKVDRRYPAVNIFSSTDADSPFKVWVRSAKSR